MVARVGGVDGDDGKRAQILAGLGGERQSSGTPRLVLCFLAEDVRDAVLVDGDQAERARGQRIAQHRGTVPRSSGARGPARLLRQHQLTRFRPAQVGNGHCIADATC